MASDIEVREERLKKLRILEDKGINPYPNVSNRNMTLKKLSDDFSNLENDKKKVVVAGRVISKRGQGGLVFVDLYDGTSKFQAVFKLDLNPYYIGHESINSGFDLFRDVLDTSDFIEVEGTLFTTKAGQPSIEVSGWRMLSKSLRAVPDAWYGLKDEDEIFRKRYLDILLNNEVREIFEKKSIFWNTFRSYLLDKNFIEVETPVLETTTGGADARPFVTHHNALDIDVYLRISAGELWQKKLLVSGMPKIFEIGRIFRNEGISPEHAQDYTQLEFYEAYSDYKKGMEMVKDLYRHVATKTFGTTKFIIQEKEVELADDWVIYDYVDIVKKEFNIDVLDCEESEVIETLKDSGVEFDSKTINKERGIDLLWKICRKRLIGPGFLINVPLYLEPLAKKSEVDNRVVERFQIILGGSEMGKGFSELNNPIDQAERFDNQEKMRKAGDDEAHMKDDSFVEALEYGMPPAFGFGVSERLFAVLCGKSIRQTQIFPLMRPKKD